MKKSKVFINSLIVLLISIFLIYYILKDNFTMSIKVLSSVNIFWLILTIIIYIIYFLMETIIFKQLIKEHKKDYSYKSSIKLHLMSKFFNGITPFSSGGQPFQLIELKKEGLSYINGTTVLIKHFFILQSSIFILSIIGIISNLIFKFFIPIGILKILIMFAILINFLLIGIIILLSTKIDVLQKIIYFFINILSKLKIIKNKNETIEKINKSSLDYQKSYHELMNNKKYFIKLVLIESLALLFEFSIPFFAFKAVGSPYNFYIGYVTISIFISLIGSYIPIPGGTGGMEYAFLNLFVFIIPKMYINICLILWRLIDYYLPMIIGGLTFNYERTKRNLKTIK